ncbi:hypothetical protein LLF88_07625 [bacterium]|nr:hypothetical protein [bacterium]
MDPLWVLVILVGGVSLAIAVGLVVMAVKVAKAARDIGSRVAEVQERLTAAGVQLARASGSIQAAEAQVNQFADKASIASHRVTKVVAVVPGILRKVEDINIKAEATVRAVGIVTARTIYNARKRSHASKGVILK